MLKVCKHWRLSKGVIFLFSVQVLKVVNRSFDVVCMTLLFKSTVQICKLRLTS